MKLTKVFNVQSADLKTAVASAVGFLRDTYTAVQGNLLLGDNMPGGFPVINLNTAPNYTGGHFSPIVVQWPFASKKQPQSVLIAQVMQPSSQPPLYSAVQVTQWTYDQTKQAIVINYIAGLNNSSKYSITLETK